MRRFLCVALAVTALAVRVRAQTMSSTLDSRRNGQVVAARRTIDWAIYFVASTDDNQGLALLNVDRVRDRGNAETLGLPALLTGCGRSY
jgi:hypothetical protein